MKNKKSKFEKELKNKDFRVSIFGSARIKKGDPHYNQINKLAKLLALNGIDLITGGGPGLMEAASSGHKEGKKISGINSHTIGLGINLFRKQRFNPAVTIRKKFNKFSSRLDDFMVLSNVVVVASGGVGTILELFYTWQLMQVNHICNIPIILLGDMWPGLIKWLEKYPLKNKFFEKKDLNLLFVAKNSDEAMKIIKLAYKDFKEGDGNFCLNYKKYQKYYDGD